MKFEKWHFGLISLILIIIASIWSWNYGFNKKNSQKQNNNSEIFSVTSTNTNIDLSKPLFIYSPTCPHCQNMEPIVKDLQSNGYQISWVDATANQNVDLMNKYNISGVPTFVRPDGKQLVGEQDQTTLKDFLKNYKK
jgi:protein-disulfide isomerase